MISATSFTLVGVVNKFLTLLLNVIIWDKHSSPTGILAVCICLLCGVFYQQAPRKADVTIALRAADEPTVAKHIEMAFNMDTSSHDEHEYNARGATKILHNGGAGSSSRGFTTRDSLLKNEDRSHPRK
jgi:hypothetical protein